MPSQQPIGVFDSGIGGLSVLSHIRRRLPGEDIIYVADTAHLPYGDKPPDIIRDRALQISRFLIERGVKAIVVACNTATAAAIAALRDRFELPIIGMEPGIKPGIEQSRNGKVAILATDGTLGSARFQDLMARFGQHADTLIQPCHGWVELVESPPGTAVDAATVVRSQLEPLLAQGVDTLVLGCTHYPFLRTQIEQITAGRALIIDTGEAVAKQLSRRLAAADLLNPADRAGSEQFWSSAADPAAVQALIRRLWGHCDGVGRLPV